MNDLIPKRLANLRDSMTQEGLDAFIVPRADEYLGEYVSPRNERLQWVSGFTGSAGMVLLLQESAALFVDGRYTIQARQQVPGACYSFHHLIEEPPITWLRDTLSKLGASKVGVDSRLHSLAWFESTQHTLGEKEIALVELADNPIDLCWSDRPRPGKKPVLLLSENYTGESSNSKRKRIAATIKDAGAELALITQLDSIAWLLNIRGADIPRLPVLLAFATLSAEGEMRLYTDPEKLPDDFAQHVGEQVSVHETKQLQQALDDLGKQGKRVLADPTTANAWCQRRCQEAGCTLIKGTDPVLLPKAQKNVTELAGMRSCHIRDGSAVARYLAWIESEVNAGRLHHEGQVADQLEAFRRELAEIHDLSFDTISAAGANGALCHYNHLNGEPKMLEQNNLYLVDSGGQYSDGTTDITRTVIIGKPDPAHIRLFTLVLKGHIALARAVFPRGTYGSQLDALARQFLWQEGLDYDHGTGHGVGAFLCVHEGPQQISKSGTQAPLMPGMVVSNEPGYYQEDCFGIRCENLMIVMPRDDEMLHFETITMAPFDLRLIDTELMSQEETNWLNNYHVEVRAKLSPLLSGGDLEWLDASTQAVGAHIT